MDSKNKKIKENKNKSLTNSNFTKSKHTIMC